LNNLNSQLKQTTLGAAPSVALFHSCKGGVEFTLQRGVNQGVDRAALRVTNYSWNRALVFFEELEKIQSGQIGAEQICPILVLNICLLLDPNCSPALLLDRNCSPVIINTNQWPLLLMGLREASTPTQPSTLSSGRLYDLHL
jgi:hypothetical protein